MTSTAKRWLNQHSAGVPVSLSVRMERALVDVAPDDSPAAISDSLLAAAVSCLRDAVDACDERQGALPLLAADALMTAACEAAAQQDGSALDGLCARIAPHDLEALAGSP
jgi:hypothetical protein